MVIESIIGGITIARMKHAAALIVLAVLNFFIVRKPVEVYQRVERLYAGPYAELFARYPAPRPGWSYWGDEAEPVPLPTLSPP